VWGFFNLVVFYILVCQVGDFNLRSIVQAAMLGLGFLLMGLVSARHFGKFHGGNFSTDAYAKSH